MRVGLDCREAALAYNTCSTINAFSSNGISNLLQLYQRTIELKRLTPDPTRALALTLELLPHPAVPRAEQLVTATRNSAMAKATPAAWINHPSARTTAGLGEGCA